MGFLNGVLPCSRGYPQTGDDAGCFCPELGGTTGTHHPSRHYPNWYVSAFLWVNYFIIIIICQTNMRIHRFYPSPKSFVPRSPFESLKIVTMNINNYDYLLLARNELSGWTLYHQNNLMEWAFIPIVLMRNWGLVVLRRCLRSQWQQQFSELTQAWLHSPCFPQGLCKCPAGLSAAIISLFLSDSMAKASGVMNPRMMSPDRVILPFSSLLSCFCWLPFQPFHCVH